MSEMTLKVGKKGEIYTNKELRERVGIHKGGKVRAIVEGKKLVIEAIPSLEEMLRKPIARISVEEAERLSEEAQKEENAYG
ncbi:MAG: AbrB/MazE/SpoVT family DNA-binding domain-containing protein [Candidatus Heimdallarchaeota archaeon]